jgi:protein-tyrosine phosphatase
MTEIIERVWLANWQDATSPEFIKRYNIGMVVNTTNHIQSPFADSIPTYRIPVVRYIDSDRLMMYHIPKVADAIDHLLATTSKSVLIHCVDATCRGPTVMAGYLILRRGLSVEDAVEFVRHKKPGALQERPPVFLTVLQALERQRPSIRRGETTIKTNLV